MNGLTEWLQTNDLRVESEREISGGCIAQTRKIVLNNGQQLLVKSMFPPISGMFQAEALGLGVLLQTRTVSVPEVLFHSSDVLILNYIEQSHKSEDYENTLAESLARLHKQKSTTFGFEIDTYCGSTRQPNEPEQDGYNFYVVKRYLYLGERCYNERLLGPDSVKKLETICSRLSALIPEQSPALLHGDLWSGNVIADEHGQPVLIDPAVYRGWPEADIAMTRLFGGFSDRFYRTYLSHNKLEQGWEGRMDLYNLWHLMNHLLLFGASYRADVERVIDRYV